MMKFIFLFLVVTSAYADMSQCMNIPHQDKKNYCMASYSGSAGFCDKIKSYEYRTQCMRMVVAKQRESTYSIMPKKEEKKE